MASETPCNLTESCPIHTGTLICRRQRVGTWSCRFSIARGLRIPSHFYGRGKSKISLCTPWRYIGGMGVWLHSFFTSVVEPTSRPGHFSLQERTPGTHWTGGWVCTFFQMKICFIVVGFGKCGTCVHWQCPLSCDSIVCEHQNAEISREQTAWNSVLCVFALKAVTFCRIVNTCMLHYAVPT